MTDDDQRGGLCLRAIGFAGVVVLMFSTQPAAAAVRISVQGASGAPGETIVVSARLASDGEVVAGLQADLSLDPHVAAIGARDGVPDCSVDAGIRKGASAFAFRPAGCD